MWVDTLSGLCRELAMRRREFIITFVAAATTWPITTGRAQQSAAPVIGFLHFGSPKPFAFQSIAFEQGLKENGYIQGVNAKIEYRWAEGHYDRLPALAADLVSNRVDIIAAIGPPCAGAAKKATSTIPIVFTTGADPIRDGLVTNLARPTGNLTGISILAVQLVPKRLELLSELVPQARRFALLVNPSNGYTEPMVQDVQEAARAKGIELSVLKASTEGDIDAAFASIGGLQIDALVIGDDPFFVSRQGQLVGLASHYAVPAKLPVS